MLLKSVFVSTTLVALVVAQGPGDTTTSTPSLSTTSTTSTGVTTGVPTIPGTDTSTTTTNALTTDTDTTFLPPTTTSTPAPPATTDDSGGGQSTGPSTSRNLAPPGQTYTPPTTIGSSTGLTGPSASPAGALQNRVASGGVVGVVAGVLAVVGLL